MKRKLYASACNARLYYVYEIPKQNNTYTIPNNIYLYRLVSSKSFI